MALELPWVFVVVTCVSATVIATSVLLICRKRTAVRVYEPDGDEGHEAGKPTKGRVVGGHHAAVQTDGGIPGEDDGAGTLVVNVRPPSALDERNPLEFSGPTPTVQATTNTRVMTAAPSATDQRLFHLGRKPRRESNELLRDVLEGASGRRVSAQGSEQSFTDSARLMTNSFFASSSEATRAHAPIYLADTLSVEFWQIDYDEITIESQLGAGSVGEVFKGYFRNTAVAVKKLLKEDLSPIDEAGFIAEISLMSRMRHPNIVLFLGCSTKKPHYCIITELMVRGSLRDIFLLKNTPLPYDLLLRILQDVCCGMIYLHAFHPPIIHRDLKTTNLLVDIAWNTKICDFGMSRFRDDDRTMSQVGTPEFTAPEISNGLRYTEKADVFSYAMCMYELIMRQRPLKDLSPLEMYSNPYETKRPDIDKSVPDNYASVMTKCWQGEPEKRPSFEEVLVDLKAIEDEVFKQLEEEQDLEMQQYGPAANVLSPSSLASIESHATGRSVLSQLDVQHVAQMRRHLVGSLGALPPNELGSLKRSLSASFGSIASAPPGVRHHAGEDTPPDGDLDRLGVPGRQSIGQLPPGGDASGVAQPQNEAAEAAEAESADADPKLRTTSTQESDDASALDIYKNDIEGAPPNDSRDSLNDNTTNLSSTAKSTSSNRPIVIQVPRRRVKPQQRSGGGERKALPLGRIRSQSVGDPRGASALSLRALVTSRRAPSPATATAGSSELGDPSDAASDYQINYEELVFGEMIGLGSMGKVYKGYWRGTGIAIKRFYRASMSFAALQGFTKEMEMMTALRHPNVVLFMGACTQGANFCLVTEYMPKGSLHDVLTNKSGAQLDWERRSSMARDAARGLNFLHSHDPPILHCDLRPHNLLVDKNWQVKVADFGLSRFRNQGKGVHPASIPWAAPEVLKKRDYTEKSDVYSFSMILWSIITREDPYEDIKPTSLIPKKVVKDQFRPELPPASACLPGWPDILTRCWADDPDTRPVFSDICESLDLAEASERKERSERQTQQKTFLDQYVNYA